jgi:tRNA A-37 threonylcarbamoyl transferase component Bud32
LRVQIKVIEGPEQGKIFSFDTRERVLVGRASSAHLCLNDPSLAEHHLMLDMNPPSVFLLDLRSQSGTFLNDEQSPVRESILQDGDRIRCGGTTLQVQVEQPQIPAHEQLTQPIIEAASEVPGRLELPGLAPLASLVPSLQSLLPGVTPSSVSAVRCSRCGQRAAHEPARARDSQVVYLCETCQEAILDEPLLPSNYRLLRELDRGGMGAVYLVEHEILGKRALKVILPKAAMAKRARDRFIREAQVQATLNAHPNIIQVYEFHELRPGIFAMIMEYFDGKSASQLLKEAEANHLPIKLSLEIMTQVLDGLSYMHQKDIVHRDVKDANILVSQQNKTRAKLLDFGLAKPYETSGASGFTQARQGGGTIPYMAPEQIINFRDVRPPADLYSAGATLYRLLSGEYPHDFPEEQERLLVALEHSIVPLSTRAPWLPIELCKVVEKALAKDIKERFSSAQEMREALLLFNDL